ncbi:efflux RND transporter periplasmic adaptor subunit [Ktedonospora formicarum]|uniref:AprE-like beta-barrel domain-containing protein n=1 Tax=Ktedonospora formicarum TaxID=2778364 RepID=A0A8J3I7T2_9CHLR|nr:HlyD family efflux transporter periplasmic adaptor subunit [Ktedonospora formicarum]GHO46284.1 hypothetical protein KSX_44470 [Ktedonospora formicarum]
MSDSVETQPQPLISDELSDAPVPPKARKPRRRTRRTWLIVLSIIVLIVLLGGGFLYWRASRNSLPSFTQAQVTTGTLSTQVSATGPIAANAEYDLNFPASGQLASISVKIGDKVTSGETLATLNVTNTQNHTSTLTLTAPGDATVAAVRGVVGENLSSGGNATSSAFIVLTDTSKLRVTASVNETDINNVKQGQQATFTVAAYTSQIFKATVGSIETVGQSSSGVVSYAVNLDVDMTSLNSAHLYPGMTATLNIITQQKAGVLMVPNSALTYSTTAISNGLVDRSTLRGLIGNRQSGEAGSQNSSTGEKRGMVLELQNGKLTPVLITTGITNGQYTEVLSGLQDGDVVVTGQIGGNSSTTASSQGGNGLFNRGGLGGGNGGFGGGNGGFGGGNRGGTGRGGNQ